MLARRLIHPRPAHNRSALRTLTTHQLALPSYRQSNAAPHHFIIDCNDQGRSIVTKDKEGIVLALEQRDLVSLVRLWVPALNLQKLVTFDLVALRLSLVMKSPPLPPVRLLPASGSTQSAFIHAPAGGSYIHFYLFSVPNRDVERQPIHPALAITTLVTLPDLR